MEIKSFITMEYDEFDKLVKEKLGIEYESVAENEWNNDSSYVSHDVMKCDVDDFFMEYDLPDIQKAIDSGDGIGLGFHQLLTYMVWKDMIPEGNYLIEVSW